MDHRSSSIYEVEHWGHILKELEFGASWKVRIAKE